MPPVVHSTFRTRRRTAGLTLIEILIAMFIFLVGCLGVLSVFPVAMNSAGRVLGETRGNMLAQSAVGQITADCRVNFDWSAATGFAGACAAGASSTTLKRAVASTSFKNTPYAQDYFVTMLDGPGRGQSRFIISDDGTTLTVAPPWTQVNFTSPATTWTYPGSLLALSPTAYEHYSITRIGLPERPLLAGSTTTPVPGEQILQGWAGSPGPYYVAPWPASGTPNYNYGSFGLNRDLAVRQIASGNGFYAGIANPLNVPTNAIQVDPLVAYYGTATSAIPPPAALALQYPQWLNATPYVAGNMVSDKGSYYICLVANTNAEPPNPYWQNAAYVTLYDANANLGALWPVAPAAQLSNYYQVRIVSGSGAGQVRTITGNTTNQLIVTPSWAILPDGSSVYEFGWANTNPANPPLAPQPATWCAQLYPVPPVAPPPCSVSGNILTDGGAAWVANQFQGKYVYITTPGEGQARAIVSNGPSQLVVTPAFTVSGPLNYIITESRGYVLITSGRATNRLFPIAWDQIDQTDGHLIVCAGTDFTSLTGITAARKPSTNIATGFLYNLQDATTFTVIGNWSQTSLAWPANDTVAPYPAMPLILNAVPDGSPINPLLWTAPPPQPAAPFCPPWFNTLNVCAQPYNAGTVSVTQGNPNVTATPGTLWLANVSPGNIFIGPDGALHRILSVGSNTSLTLADNYEGQNQPVGGYTIFSGPPNRLALDQYNVSAQGGGAYTSEYSYGVVFSDSGTDPSLPVRVDVFVWRNFDTTRDFVENQKPVGHMAGYIRRP